MKKGKQIILFVLVVCAGFFIIDNFLFGKVGIDCNCFDSQLASEECWAVCEPYGGCAAYWARFPGSCEYTYICRTLVRNYCGNIMDRKIIYGFHYVYCFTCEAL